MRGRIILALIVIVGLSAMALGPSLFAQQEAKPKPAAKPADKGWSYVDSHADYIKTQWGKQKVTLMKGNVKFIHKDTTLTSDLIQYDEPTRTAVSPGAINIANPECDIKGVKGTAFLKKKLGVIEGNVVMLVKPKPGQAEEAEKDSPAKFKVPTTITCAKLEYLYKDKIATATGGVIFKQDKRTASADRAIYDQNKEILTLTGNVSGTDEDGRTFSTQQNVVIRLKKGEEGIDVWKGHATFKIDLGNEE